jgi:peroxiredoxin
MRTLLFIGMLIALGLGALVAPVSANAAEGTSGIAVDQAIQKLDQATTRMTEYLHRDQNLRISTTTNWTLRGDQPRSGVTHCRFAAQQGGRFSLEVNSGDAHNASLACGGDGKTITRRYADGPNVIYSRLPGERAMLIDDSLTDASLKGTGLNILLRPDAHTYLMSTVSDVQDLGQEELQGRMADHFSANWFGGSKIEMWIATGDEPFLLRWVRRQTVDLGQGPQQLEMDSQLVWETGITFSADPSQISLPESAVEVADLQSYLLKGGTGALLGDVAPSPALRLLDGTDWQLTKHRDESAVVLVFFASWASPSTIDMPEISKLIGDFKGLPATFYLISVGESDANVKAFVETSKYAYPVVLDPNRKAAAAYRVTSLPVAVLIGKDGTLQATHVGLDPASRDRIRAELKSLIDGKPLLPAAK